MKNCKRCKLTCARSSTPTKPIVKARIPLADAKAIFERQGYDDKLRLLNYRTKDYLTVYTLRGLTDYFYGYMVPSTGYLRTFALTPLSNGFVLQFPRRAHPDQLEKADRPSKLAAVFQRHAEYMRVMEVEDVGSLNQAIESKRIREVIMVAEALHERRIAEMRAGHRAEARRDSPDLDRRAVVVGQDHVLQAPRRAAVGLRPAPHRDRDGQLLCRSRQDAARQKRRVRL